MACRRSTLTRIENVRLYPSTGQIRALERILSACCDLYNTGSAERRVAYESWMRRRFLVCGFAAVLLTTSHFVAFARDQVTTLRIVVEDSRSLAPLQATISLQGSVNVSTSTDARGNASLPELPPGDYDLTASSRDSVSLRERIHVDSAAVEIEIRLRRNGVKQIGSVKVKARAAFELARNSASDPISVLSSGPGGAATIATLPGVEFAEPDQPGSPRTVSLEGQDPTRSAVSADGAPLNIPGMAADLRGLDVDLIDNAAVQYAAKAGSSGTLSLSTLRPTSAWQTSTELSYGTFDRAFASLSAQGSFAGTGIAFKHAYRDEASPLDGSAYLDQSGENYIHDGSSNRSGNSLTVQAAPSGALAFHHIDSSQDDGALCTLYINATPCGYGPGNTTNSSFTLNSVSDALGLHQLSLGLSAYDMTSTTNENFGNALIGGLRVPWQESTSQETVGFALLATETLHDQDLTLGVNGAHRVESENVAQSAISTISTSSAFSIRSLEISLNDLVHVSRDTAIRAGVDFVALSTGNQGSLGSIGVSTSAGGNVFDVSAAAGKAVTQSAPGTFASVTPVGGLVFDCASGSAFGSGAGTLSATPDLQTLRAGVRHDFKSGQFTLQVFDESEQHAPYSTFVDAKSLAPGALPPNYLPNALAYAGSSAVCANRQIQEIYLNTPLAQTTLSFRGAHLLDSVHVTPQISVDTVLDLTSATAKSSDPLSKASTTVFNHGSQLRGVPIVTGSMTIAYRPQGSPLSLYAGGRYFGWNGPTALPPHARLDIAGVLRVKAGILSLLVDNVLNRYPGKFTTSAFAEPYILADGRQLSGFAQPQTPRSVMLSFSTAIGRNAQIGDSLSGAFPTTSKGAPLVPGTLILPWPQSPPRQPFQENNGSACKPGELEKAEEVLASIKAAQGDSPRSGSAAEKPVPGLTIAAQSVNGQKVIDVQMRRLSFVQALFDCAAIHLGRPDEARSADLPYESFQSLTSVTVHFAPSKGLYFVQVPAASDLAQRFRTYAMPAQAPADPFQESNDCPAELKPIASEMLAAFRIWAVRPDGGISGWQVIRHRAASPVESDWSELRSDEIGAGTALLSCAHIVAAHLTELSRYGLSGALPPAFNFSSHVGLYVLSK